VPAISKFVLEDKHHSSPLGMLLRLFMYSKVEKCICFLVIVLINNIYTINRNFNTGRKWNSENILRRLTDSGDSVFISILDLTVLGELNIWTA